MSDRLYVPLWVRILLIAFANLAMLGVLFVLFLRMQLRPDLESFVLAGAREGILRVAQAVGTELNGADVAQWDGILDRYSREFGVGLLLYRNTGEQLAGPPTRLPPEVDAVMPRGPLPPSRTGPPRPPGPTLTAFLAPGPPFLAIATSGPKYWTGVRMSIAKGTDTELTRTVLMLTSPTFFTNPFFFDLTPWLTIAGAAVFISALCWLPLMRNLTRSISDMTRATEQIAKGQFAVTLTGDRRDELGSLRTSITRMAARLETLTEGRKRFLGAAAHELRSPLARMQVATEILERTAAVPDQKYLGGLKDDLDVMTRLTDELLQFASAEAAVGSPSLVPVNVADAVHAAVRLEGLDSVEIQTDVDARLMVQANREYLLRSVTNVLRNAIRYAGDRGPILISARRKEQLVEISVADSGPGVPEDAREKVFTPFYRLDAARNRQTGGTGLGLAIVRTCIEACGGTVSCHNRRPSGLDVIIRLPSTSSTS